MVDIVKSAEQKRFSGVVRDLRNIDLPSLKPILATWIKDRDTGQPLTEEIEEDLQIMSDSITHNNDRTYVVAETPEGEVIGIVGFKTPDVRMIPFTQTSKPAELVNAYVKSDERKGRGVGKALVSELENKARKAGYTEIVLNSGPRYKDTGWGFYDRLINNVDRYERVGVAEGYYGEGGDAPVWRKIL